MVFETSNSGGGGRRREEGGEEVDYEGTDESGHERRSNYRGRGSRGGRGSYYNGNRNRESSPSQTQQPQAQSNTSWRTNDNGAVIENSAEASDFRQSPKPAGGRGSRGRGAGRGGGFIPRGGFVPRAKSD